MLVRTVALGIIAWMAATLTMAAETAPTAGPEKAKPDQAITNGIPIDSGFVIVKGEYLSAPYVIGTRGEALFINGVPIDTQRLYVRSWGRGGYSRRWSSQPRTNLEDVPRDASRDETEEERPPRWLPDYNYAAIVERQLQNNGLLIVFDDDMATFMHGGFETPILRILVSDESRDDKLKALMKLQTGQIESARWAQLVDAFQNSPDLASRVQQVKLPPQTRPTVNSRRPVALPNLPNFIIFGITVMGIILGVVAFGSLLNHRPHGKAAWRDIDTSGDNIPMTTRNVILVALLSFFDLGCTLLARSSIGFVEMNPLGSSMIDSPLLLAGFKVTSVFVGCVILFSLRRYRGAQAASWWLCLVCTILTFRWATYGSLMLA